MHRAETIAVWRTRNESMLARFTSLTGGASEEVLNTRVSPSTWSPAQVVHHMVLANTAYLQAIEAALHSAKRVEGDPPVRYSFFGRLLCQAAGPDGNAPAPRTLHPGDNIIGTAILQEWEQQQAHLLSLLNRSATVDLSRVRVWNPLVRVIPMNMADCFAILTAHTERHIGQIEARIPARNLERGSQLI